MIKTSVPDSEKQNKQTGVTETIVLVSTSCRKAADKKDNPGFQSVKGRKRKGAREQEEAVGTKTPRKEHRRKTEEIPRSLNHSTSSR